MKEIDWIKLTVAIGIILICLTVAVLAEGSEIALDDYILPDHYGNLQISPEDMVTNSPPELKNGGLAEKELDLATTEPKNQDKSDSAENFPPTPTSQYYSNPYPYPSPQPTVTWDIPPRPTRSP